MSKRSQSKPIKYETKRTHSRRSDGKPSGNRPERFAGKPLVAGSTRRSAASAHSNKAVERAALAEERKREQVVLDEACAPFAGRTLAVVGGGAAGLAAAVRAGEAFAAHTSGGASVCVPVRIVVFEADDRVGKTILATGNGRCNFSNEHIDARQYYQGEFVAAARRALAQRESASGSAQDGQTAVSPCGEEGAQASGQECAQPAARHVAAAAQRTACDPASPDPVHRFFAQHGLLWREEEDGRQYPLANKANVVVNLLRQALADCGGIEAVGAPVARIEPPREQGGPFTLHLADGRFARADAVIVAVGGKPQAIDIDGVPQLRFRRVLGPLKTAGDEARELNNIRAKAQVTLLRSDDRTADGAPGSARAYPGRRVVAREDGEVMFRTYGVSGIAVFNLSRFAWPGDELSIDFLSQGTTLAPDDFAQERLHLLAGRAKTLGAPFSCGRFLGGVVLPAVAQIVLRRCGLAASDACAESEATALARQLADFRLEVAGIGDEANCQVHRGGIDVGALDARTMAVRSVPGLFAAGEAVDVDGPCGGYNLDWAWTSGLLAADAACRFLAESESGRAARAEDAGTAADGGAAETDGVVAGAPRAERAHAGRRANRCESSHRTAGHNKGGAND